MIDIFIKLVEKIIELLKTRHESKEKVFKEIIEPIFNDMTIVVHDYLSFFKEAEIIVQPGSDLLSIKLHEVINKIEGRREECLHIRIKTRQMADLLSANMKDEAVVDFANNIVDFFFSMKGSTSTELISDSSMMIDLFERLETSTLSKRELYDIIKQVEFRLEKSWAEITKSYALLRLKYLATPYYKM